MPVRLMNMTALHAAPAKHISATYRLYLPMRWCCRLSPLYPDTLMVGMELRDKVSSYVKERIGEQSVGSERGMGTGTGVWVAKGRRPTALCLVVCWAQ